MNNNKMIIIGEKESFITIVLVKKVQETGAECSFVPWKIDQISKNLDGVSLITLFMKEEELPGEDVIHFLTDVMEERDIQLMIIGEAYDVDCMCDRFPRDLIYQTFKRPDRKSVV